MGLNTNYFRNISVNKIMITLKVRTVKACSVQNAPAGVLAMFSFLNMSPRCLKVFKCTLIFEMCYIFQYNLYNKIDMYHVPLIYFISHVAPLMIARI